MASQAHSASSFSAAALLTWDLRLVAVAATALAVLVTYVTTSLRGRRSQQGEEPPSVPYWVPLVGNTLSFALNTEKFVGGLLYAPVSSGLGCPL